MQAVYFKAQMLDHLGEYRKAVELLDYGLRIAPTFLDFHVQKAVVYRSTGNPAEAYKQINIAREMDTADRYLNTKCSRYALRAGEF